MAEIKKKRGRPILPNAKRRLIALRLDDELMQVIERKAADTGASVSVVIRDTIAAAGAEMSCYADDGKAEPETGSKQVQT